MKKYSYLLLSLFCYSCSEKETVGPNAEDFAFAPVITSAFTRSDDTLDVASGESVFFTASFEKDVVWKITLGGENTHAVKTFTGAGKIINSTNSLWSGSPDSPPVFFQEKVTAVLSFPDYPSSPFYSVDFYIRKPTGTSEGVLITDFNVSKVGAGWPSDWPTTVNTNSLYSYPDGNNYMYMIGHPWQGNNNPYIDYMTITPSEANTDYGNYFPLYVNPEQVFFNIMVYNTGTEDTWFNVNFKEENGATRELTIRPDWIGWKLISVRYSELSSASVNPPTPDKITSITFLLFSDEDQSHSILTDVSIAFDHPIFTHHVPYQP